MKSSSSRTIHLGQLPSHTNIKRRRVLVVPTADGQLPPDNNDLPVPDLTTPPVDSEPQLKKRKVESEATTAKPTPSSAYDLDEDEDALKQKYANSSSEGSDDDEDSDEDEELERLKLEKARLAKIQQMRKQNLGGDASASDVSSSSRVLSSFQEDVLFRRNVAVSSQKSKPTSDVQSSQVHKEFLSNFFK